MATSRGIDEDDVKFLRGRICHGVLGDVGSVFTITFLV